MSYCLAKHSSGVLCGRMAGHVDHQDRGDLERAEHCAFDFRQTFGDPPRPGAAVVWVDEPARSVVEQSDLDPLGTYKQARASGYTGDTCSHCGAMSMVRNGSCLKCVSCGTTTGCS